MTPGLACHDGGMQAPAALTIAPVGCVVAIAVVIACGACATASVHLDIVAPGSEEFG